MEKIELKRGDKGLQVKLIQEWLVLHKILVDIDGVFGFATETAVRRFQCQCAATKIDGIVNEHLMDVLSEPLGRATKPIIPAESVGLTVVKAAMQHLQEEPREVGGQNRGPWVRLYCKGRDGKEFAWCAGFVSTILKQAFEAHRQQLPFPYTLSCDTMAKMSAERLVCPANGDEAGRFRIRPGAIFLIRKTETDWVHTGIVTNIHGNHFETIEGNSNDEGSREGHELCARVRGYDRKDFVPV